MYDELDDKPTLKQRLTDWYNARIQKGYYKAWSFIVNVAGFVLASLPELVNMLLSSVSMGLDAVPTLDPMHKVYILVAVNVLTILLKPIKQAPNSLAIAAAPSPTNGVADDRDASS